MRRIDLETQLSLRSAFHFPLQNREARRDVLIGALWLLVPIVGWLLNMGHRIQMVHNMHRGRPAWPAWERPGRLLKMGAITFLGMLEYHMPALVIGTFAWRTGSTALWTATVLFWLAATATVPGYMTHYCRKLDPREVFNPVRAARRVVQGGRAYWRAWGIALSALALSFIGLLALGVGFLVTSVWFWQVAGYSFAVVFTDRFRLADFDS